MSKNLLDVLKENKKIQDSMIDNKNKILYPQIKPFKMTKISDTHIGTSVFKYELQPRMNYYPIYGFLDNYKKVEKDVSLAKTTTDISIDKHFRIEHIKPIQEIPIAYFKYRMQGGRTIDDIRLDNFRHEMGTKTEFHSLLEQERRPDKLLEEIESSDYNINLKYLLSKARSNLKSVIPATIPVIPVVVPTTPTTPTTHIPVTPIVTPTSPTISSVIEENETKKISEKEEDELDKLVNKKLFDDKKTKHSELNQREYEASFNEALDSFLSLHYTPEQAELIHERRKQKKDPGKNDSTRFVDKDLKTYCDRQLKNILSKIERQKNKIFPLGKSPGKPPGTLDMKFYEKEEDENTKIGSYFVHEKDDEKTRIG